MPGEADVLTEKPLVIIADASTARESRFRFRPHVRAITGRDTKVPRLIWTETETRVKRWMGDTDDSGIPRFGTGRERHVFHFRGTIEFASPTGNENPYGIIR